MDLVSVIIPTYNRFKYLQNAIQSVKNQTYKNVEIIVVNDRSTQEEYYNHKFEGCTIIHLEKNSRQIFGYPCGGYVRNQGLYLSKGQYVCFLDDDDSFLPNKIETQINIMKEKSFNLCATDVYTGHGPYDDSKNYVRYSEDRCKQYILNRIGLPEIPDVYTFDVLIRNNCIINSSVMLTRDLIFKLNGYRSLKNGDEDYDLWLRAVTITPCYNCKIPLGYYDLGHGDGQNY
jgi:glycosyltransferase involved in cell wall biosynthesis